MPGVFPNISDQRSAEAAAYRRLYKQARWLRLRDAHLRIEPICRMCHEQGRIHVEPKMAVDHVRPHNGDLVLFFDPDNLQTLCPSHHSAAKQQIEHRGYSSEVDANGAPVDPNHPFNR